MSDPSRPLNTENLSPWTKFQAGVRFGPQYPLDVQLQRAPKSTISEREWDIHLYRSGDNEDPELNEVVYHVFDVWTEKTQDPDDNADPDPYTYPDGAWWVDGDDDPLENSDENPPINIEYWALEFDTAYAGNLNYNGVGLVHASNKVDEHHPFYNNRFKLFVLMLHAVPLGIKRITPVTRWNVSAAMAETDWDEKTGANTDFKKLYNSAVDYYLKNCGDEEFRKKFPVNFRLPLLRVNREIRPNQVQKIQEAEVNTEPWLAKDKKFDMENKPATEGTSTVHENPAENEG